MKNIAMIINGNVVNVAVWDGVSLWDPGTQYSLVDVTNLVCDDGSPIQCACTYDGTNFYPSVEQD